MKNVNYLKRRIIVSLIMDAIWVVLGFGGALFILGSVGSFEWARISMMQFFVQVVIASASIYVAHIVFTINEAFKAKYINNVRIVK